MLVVPQFIVDTVGPALSADHNQGAVMAEQLARDPGSSELLLKLMAEEVGTPVPLADALRLPPLVLGRRWNELADRLRAAAAAAHGG